jgi:hypothetical protein
MGSDFRIDFAIIGAAKAATSSLAEYLAEHPGVCFSYHKEPQYFCHNADWDNPTKLAEYHSLWKPKPGQICGEGSTRYSYIEEPTYRRLWQYNPKLKIIYVMRHPLDRTISQFSYETLRGRLEGSIEAEFLTKHYIVNASRYAVFAEAYLRYFSPEQMLFMKYDEIAADSVAASRRAAEFLGLDPAGIPEKLIIKNPTIGRIGIKKKYKAIADNRFLVDKVRPLIPKFIRRPFRDIFYKPVKAKMEVPRDLQEFVWNLTVHDLLRTQELTGLDLSDWIARGEQQFFAEAPFKPDFAR